VNRKGRWPEYLAEAAALGIFMISASLFTTLLEHYQSPLLVLVPHAFARRALMGLAMGLTAAAIIYSPLGARSGAHMNPSVSLAFVRLGKLPPTDAACYLVAQFTGGIAGMVAASALLGHFLAEPSVHFVQTRPGSAGLLAAAVGELLISFITFSVLLRVAARPKTMRLVGAAAGILVMLNISFEAPLSGMSMNPARTLAPALLAGTFDALWIYFIAPPFGMLLAAEWFRSTMRAAPCPRLNHTTRVPCIFCGDVCTTT
jgi:aquaporin Z